MGYINRAKGCLLITTHYPNAAGTNTNITSTNPTSSNHWDTVNDVTSDGWTTCVYEDLSTYNLDTYNFANPSLTGLIQWIKVIGNYAPGSGGGTIAAKAALYIAATAYYGTEFSKSAAGYSDFYHKWDINPNTGLHWTWTDINNLEFGLAIHGYQPTGTAGICSMVNLQIARFI